VNPFFAELKRVYREISNPNVPASVLSIPDRYNICTRLCTVAFYRMIAALRRASVKSGQALEHLLEFIYYVYRFYSGLLEERNLRPSGEKWIEAQRNLARNRMSVGIHVANHAASDPPSSTEHRTPPAALPIKPPMPCIDNSPVPSAGVRASAAELDDEVERDR
jgi:hypothetical protein